jgi:hypothetical protein
LNVKDNQPVLKEEIAGYVQDTQLRGTVIQCDERQSGAKDGIYGIGSAGRTGRNWPASVR